MKPIQRRHPWLVTCVFLCLVSVFSIQTAVSAEADQSLTVADLKCEYRVNPLGIDVERPRLSWRLESDVRGQAQRSYRIYVATSRELLDQNNGDLWDSGQVESNQTIHVPYAGRPLRSGERAYWKVEVQPTLIDRDSAAVSKPAWWEAAIVDADGWQAKWINDGRENPTEEADHFKTDPAPLFRRAFELSSPVRRARLYISGLGYYDAWINGQPVGDHELDPGWTDYSDRVYYSTYDVTDLLKSGDGMHCIAASVGNGWYNLLPLKMWGRRNLRGTLICGRPRLIAQLEIELADGTRQTIATDRTWKVTQGPMQRNSVFLGEVYDAQKEIKGWNLAQHDDSAWTQATIATEPVGPLQAQPLEPIRVTDRFKPVAITEPEPGVFIYDMGQNFGGRIRLKIDQPAGTQINLRYGELLAEDGTLNPRTSACGQIKGRPKLDESGRELGVWDPVYPSSAWQGDSYIAAGREEEVYEPRFTFHAFRYVELTGYKGRPTLDMVEGQRMNSDVQSAGQFSTSNELLNDIQEICRRTFLSNIFSVQSDCPHRERFGYGGDLVNTCDALILNYDMVNFYTKATWDWHDAALPDGMLTDTAPFVGIQYCGVGWAMAHPMLQEKLYQYYGNRRLVEEQYETASRWLDLVRAQFPEHIVTQGLSDHEGLEPKPAPQMVTPLYCESARMLSRLAKLLGKEEDAQRYAQLSEAIRKAWCEKFVDGETGVVSPGTQASHAFALYLDMLPKELQDAALEYLIEDIKVKREGHFATGIFGTKYALDQLSRRSRTDVAYDVVTNRDFPGWGYMLDNGATTLWEHWAMSDNTFSHNHPMFGSVSQWFFNWLAGIQPADDAAGFDRIVLCPQLVEDLDWVKCSYDSIRGPIVSNWKRQDGEVVLEIEIPVGATASLCLPADSPDRISEGAGPASEAQGVQFVSAKDGTVVYRVSSGRYRFVISR